MEFIWTVLCDCKITGTNENVHPDVLLMLARGFNSVYMFQFLNTQYEMRIATMESAKNIKQEASSENKKKHTQLETK